MLEELREEIDKCDREIIALIEKRLSIAKEIGVYKKRNDLSIYDQKREEELMEKLKGYASGDLTGEMVEKIYREIISAAKEIQK